MNELIRRVGKTENIIPTLLRNESTFISNLNLEISVGTFYFFPEKRSFFEGSLLSFFTLLNRANTSVYAYQRRNVNVSYTLSRRYSRIISRVYKNN